MIKNQRGIALITVLWVLMVLMVIVFSFSYLTKTEALSTYSFREGVEKKFWAEAGIERGILELFYRSKMQGSAIKDLVEGGEVWKIDGSPFTGQIGEGNYVVKIFDESGKININTAPELLLRRLISGLGIQDTELDTIVDSIMDWKDKDDLTRLHGAESNYYQSLPEPYKAKNANFDTLEELLLVKGVTRELLFGNEKKKGLIEFLTAVANVNSININAAPKEVLMAASPNLSPELTDMIINYRRDKEIKNLAEIEGLIGQKFIQILPINVTPSTTFTIESFGYKQKTQSGLGIRATVMLIGNNQYKYLYYKTPIAFKPAETLSEGPSPTG